MTDPALEQAVSFAQWYLLRGATEEEIDNRLQVSPDHSWLSEAERRVVVTRASCLACLTRKVWQAFPMLKPELLPTGWLRRQRPRGKKNNRPNR